MRSLMVFVLLLNVFSCTKDKVTVVPNTTAEDTVTYSMYILPIFNNKCNGCHAYPGTGGISLDNYQMAHDLAMSGYIIGCIYGLPGYLPMPPAGFPSLTPTEKLLIHTWVEQGARE